MMNKRDVWKVAIQAIKIRYVQKLGIQQDRHLVLRFRWPLVFFLEITRQILLVNSQTSGLLRCEGECIQVLASSRIDDEDESSFAVASYYTKGEWWDPIAARWGDRIDDVISQAILLVHIWGYCSMNAWFHSTSSWIAFRFLGVCSCFPLLFEGIGVSQKKNLWLFPYYYLVSPAKLYWQLDDVRSLPYSGESTVPKQSIWWPISRRECYIVERILSMRQESSLGFPFRVR